MDLDPILHEAMLTPDELPGWAPLPHQPSLEISPFQSTDYADRFIREAMVTMGCEETGQILVQHVGVLEERGASQLENDLLTPPTSTPGGEMVRESSTEAWAVRPLAVPDVGDQRIGFRLIAGFDDSRPFLTDNVYIRRGRVASALVRVDRLGAAAASDGIGPLAELADRKLASVAAKIR